jgi:hypothetical protein
LGNFIAADFNRRLSKKIILSAVGTVHFIYNQSSKEKMYRAYGTQNDKPRRIKIRRYKIAQAYGFLKGRNMSH